jgi:hypothetical protein
MSNRTEAEILNARARAKEIVQELLDLGMTMQEISSELKKGLKAKNEVLHMRKDNPCQSGNGSLP